MLILFGDGCVATFSLFNNLGGVVGAFIYDFTIGKVIVARGTGLSGDSELKGEAVREPAVGD